MSRDSSSKLLSIVNSETPADVFLYVVTVKWEDLTYSRFVRNYEDIISRGNTFTASSFEIALPEEPLDTIPTIKFRFGVSEKVPLQRLITATQLPELTLEVVLASNPDIVEVGPFTFDMRGFSINGVIVDVEAGFEPFLDLSVPQLKYTPMLFPGLFEHVRGDD